MTATSLLSGLFLSACAQSMERTERPVLEVKANYWNASARSGSLTITRGSRPGSASKVYFKELNLKSKGIAEFGERVSVSNNWRTHVGFSKIEMEGDATVDRPFIYHGEEYAAGSKVRTWFELIGVDVGGEGLLFETGTSPVKSRLWAGLNCHVLDFFSRIRGDGKDEMRKYAFGFASASATYEYQAENGGLNARILYGPGNNSGDYLFMTEAKLLLKAKEDITLSLGWKHSKRNSKCYTNHFENELSGPTLGLHIKF